MRKLEGRWFDMVDDMRMVERNVEFDVLNVEIFKGRECIGGVWERYKKRVRGVERE